MSNRSSTDRANAIYDFCGWLIVAAGGLSLGLIAYLVWRAI